MPPKRAAVSPHYQNHAKNKKVKFSATMPELEDKSQNSEDSESEPNEQDFDQESNQSSEKSNDMEVSQQNSSSSEQSKPTKRKAQKSRDQEQQSSEQQENNDSESEQASSSSQQNEVQQKIKDKTPLQIPQQQSSSNENIPRQQVETDDIDSNEEKESDVLNNDGKGEIIEEEKIVEEEPSKKATNENQVLNNEESEEEIFVPLKNDVIKPEQKMDLQNNDQAEQKELLSEQKQKKDNEELPQKKNKKDKKQKKEKKSKKKHSKSNQQQQQPILQQAPEQKHQTLPIDKQQTDQEQAAQQDHTFYEQLHPYLMIVGTAVIESFMNTKTIYKQDQASGWGSKLSQKVLLKVYMDDVQGLEDFDQEGEETDDPERIQKEKLVQAKIEKNKFYKRVQSELNELASEQNIKKISLAKIYFLIQKYKLIASCIIMEKKPKLPASVNIKTSCFWNRQKDGQINFTYDGTPLSAMLTIYGMFDEKKNGQRKE